MREESRMHVHVICADGEAKYWLEPAVEVARNHRLNPQQLSEIRKIVEANKDEFIAAWKRVFGG